MMSAQGERLKNLLAGRKGPRKGPGRGGFRRWWLVVVGVVLLIIVVGVWLFRQASREAGPAVTPTPSLGAKGGGFGQIGARPGEPGPSPTPLPGEPTPIPQPTAAPPEFPVEKVRDPYTNREVPVAADRLLVTFREGVTAKQRQKLWRSLGGVREEDLGLNIFNLFFPAGTNLEEVRRQLEKSPLVKYAERDGVVEPFFDPDDPLYPDSSWTEVINASQAWEYIRDGEKIPVAIVDQGVMKNHSDLPEVTYAIPYSGSGFHGTHVAGIACALTNNHNGVASVSFNGCFLIGAQGLSNSTGSGSTGQVIRAYNAAVEAGAKVINMSLGGPAYSRSFQDAIAAAWERGVLTVAAAGNVWTTARSYPAGYEKVIAVAATTGSGAPASFSTHSAQWVDVAAPGVNINSTWNNGGYNRISGTSMASPVVAGLAALCWSANPGLTNEQVQQYIFEGAHGDGDGYARVGPSANFSTHGLINAEETARLCSNAEPLPTPTPTPTPQESGLSCYPEEWKCTDDDVVDPEQRCCQCGAVIAPPPGKVLCRTNEDEGQKDGTGRTGIYRQYRWFDPDLGKVVQVPPLRPPQEIRPIFPTPTP